MKGMLIGILISSLILASLAIFAVMVMNNQIKSASKIAKDSGATNQETANPTALASDIKTKTDFKSIETGLKAYFSDAGYYPFTLNDLQTSGNLQGIDISSYSYLRCDGDTVVVKKGSVGFKLDEVQVSEETSC